MTEKTEKAIEMSLDQRIELEKELRKTLREYRKVSFDSEITDVMRQRCNRLIRYLGYKIQQPDNKDVNS